MNRIYSLLFLMFALAACTAQDVTESVGQSMKGLCRNTPGRCTVYDERGRAE